MDHLRNVIIADRAYLIYEGRVESEGWKDFLITGPISRRPYLGERFSKGLLPRKST